MTEINFSLLWFPLWSYQGLSLKFISLVLLEPNQQSCRKLQSFLILLDIVEIQSLGCPVQQETGASKLGSKSGPDDFKQLGIICASV